MATELLGMGTITGGGQKERGFDGVVDPQCTLSRGYQG